LFLSGSTKKKNLYPNNRQTDEISINFLIQRRRVCKWRPSKIVTEKLLTAFSLPKQNVVHYMWTASKEKFDLINTDWKGKQQNCMRIKRKCSIRRIRNTWAIQYIANTCTFLRKYISNLCCAKNSRKFPSASCLSSSLIMHISPAPLTHIHWRLDT
jgi:hypothetical protein